MNIPYSLIAKEIGVELLDAHTDPATVYISQAHTRGELIVAPVDSDHAIFFEYRIQERVFRVMKDYRFFQLCLPAVYGMGCVNSEWDWVLRKKYEGTAYHKLSNNTYSWPIQLAREMALIIFDLSQVPVLKFKSDVSAVHYPEQLSAYAQRIRSLTISDLERAMLNRSIAEMQIFFDAKVPTLYCISNGKVFPESLIHLDEAIVLNDWRNASIQALEHIVASTIIHTLPYKEFANTVYRELLAYCDIQQEWMKQMCIFVLIEKVANQEMLPSECFQMLAEVENICIT